MLPENWVSPMHKNLKKKHIYLKMRFWGQQSILADAQSEIYCEHLAGRESSVEIVK